ncbi:hypothetical protein GUJ93_ZPchr0008g13233 [Zizania palustris]|uniref:Uncharacterized protein n=1 Tax=Zizania palustris TaxID=103762 RepID=A0A8J5VHZ9_ZIZPA|nr:hypothetical protein GUJ93_ZPchr0008g13233 [Zizania palustris]
MVFLGRNCLLDNPTEKEALILIESLLAKESKMHCSVAYSSMTLEWASSSESSECADESDMQTTASWAGVVDMANTKLRKTSKGLWGAELPDLHGKDRLEAPEPKSSWIAGSSRRGSWHRFRGEICRGGCYDLGFGGWRLGIIYHRLGDLCFRLARLESIWREVEGRFRGRSTGSGRRESPAAGSLWALVSRG